MTFKWPHVRDDGTIDCLTSDTKWQSLFISAWQRANNLPTLNDAVRRRAIALRRFEKAVRQLQFAYKQKRTVLRTSQFKQELLEYAWHPSRVHYMSEEFEGPWG